MAQVQRRILAAVSLTLAAAAATAGVSLLLAAAVGTPKFYPDDPIWKEPPPIPVNKIQKRDLSDYYDFFWHTFATPGEKQPQKGEPIRAQGVNTLGEVPDGSWYTNRHARTRMTLEELRRGAGSGGGPPREGLWKVISAKNEGVTPGFTIEDSRGLRYMIKVDPPDNPGMATGADVIGAKFFYALGYWVPEYYVVKFDRERLIIDAKAALTDAQGKKRPMKARDVDEILFSVPRDSDGRFRGVASKYLSDGIGPFRYHGLRRDDPNDIVIHERRRDLRGLFVFAAWLGHNDAKSLNDLDCLVEDNGAKYVRHYLIDFGAAFGSDSFTAKSPRAGNQYLFEFRPSVIQIATLGLYVPRWAKAHYPDLPEVGRFESDLFEPERWKPNYPNPAFDNRLPDDTFWAARQVMAFRDDEIRAIVETGQYSDPRSVDWITGRLIARRDKIGRTYFDRVLPLDQLRVEAGQLAFDDLSVGYGFTGPRQYQIQWFRFDNMSRQKTPLLGAATQAIPSEARNARSGDYFAAEIRAEDPKKTVTAYLRYRDGGLQVVGIDRAW
jgi:hypothetical protein